MGESQTDRVHNAQYPIKIARVQQHIENGACRWVGAGRVRGTGVGIARVARVNLVIDADRWKANTSTGVVISNMPRCTGGEETAATYVKFRGAKYLFAKNEICVFIRMFLFLESNSRRIRIWELKS